VCFTAGGIKLKFQGQNLRSEKENCGTQYNNSSGTANIEFKGTESRNVKVCS
jgi:hypothetical protein